MPFFDANKLGIHIDYDDNMSVVGGSLRGVVNIFARGTVTLCGASLRYRILEGCAMAGDANRTNPDTYSIEYVLFGARSAKHAMPVIVRPGHYSYPFAIPIPASAPPTQRFGGVGDPSLLNMFSKEMVPTGGPCGPAVRVEHLVEVVVYVALSWKDKHQSRNAPCVVTCAPPSLLTSTTNGAEGRVRSGDSLIHTPKGFFNTLATYFTSGPLKSTEQADCDLFVYNTTVSLADSPFLHFAVRGKTNCPYHVKLVRVVKYTFNPANPNYAAIVAAAVSQTVNGNDSGSAHHGNRTTVVRSASGGTPVTFTDEQVISSTTMPVLNTNNSNAPVKGRLLISPQSQEHSVSFTGKCVSVQYYVTMSLQYLSNSTGSSIPPERQMRIPIQICHGTFEHGCETAVDDDPNRPHYALNAPADGYLISDGTVMGYDCPPSGENAQFRPVAPVTDSAVVSTLWSDAAHEATLARPNGGAAANSPAAAAATRTPPVPREGGAAHQSSSPPTTTNTYKGKQQPPSLDQYKRAANPTTTAAPAAAAAPPIRKEAPPLPPPTATTAAACATAKPTNIPTTVASPATTQPSAAANHVVTHNTFDDRHFESLSPLPNDNGVGNTASQQTANTGNVPITTPPLDNTSVAATPPPSFRPTGLHRDMFSDVPPSWVRADREPLREPIVDIPLVDNEEENSDNANAVAIDRVGTTLNVM